MQPTEEQLAIIEAAITGKDSLLINALAGAAKTTTLMLICQALPVQPILSLAFNKRIAEEMTKRLPGHVKCTTLNSIGHRVWMQACSKKILLNTKKSYEALKSRVDSLRKTEKDEAYEYFSDTLRTIGFAKSRGYVPDGHFPHAARIIDSNGFWGSLEEEPTPLTTALVDGVLIDSIKMAYEGHIDFDDQIYMPTLFGGSWPSFPLVMVDEAQDLSPLNHAMLKKLAKTRLIAVGDPWQSIYAFRGAATGSMAALKTAFNMTEMNLSISFRCPRSIIRRAQSRAPHMKWPEWAKEGSINELETWNAASIPDGAAIICRNNAPLFSCALRLLRAGRGVRLVGSDLGPQLIKTLKKLGAPSLSQELTLNAIDNWEAEKLRKSRSPAATADKAECLRVFSYFGNTLGEAIAYAEHIFAAAGPIQLLSGHKSKGLEWDTVYHLDPQRIPSPYAKEGEALEQEYNVRYVIETRAKETLNLVTMEGFDE